MSGNTEITISCPVCFGEGTYDCEEASGVYQNFICHYCAGDGTVTRSTSILSPEEIARYAAVRAEDEMKE